MLDPLTDDLGGPYDGVWANASLLHVRRENLSVVMRRLAEATRLHGALHLTVKEGDGEGWSTHGSVEAPRHFTYWRAPDLRAVLEESGWECLGEVENWPGQRERWLAVTATAMDQRPVGTAADL